jgi:hypothetical protein
LTKVEVRWQSDARFVTGFLVETRISGNNWQEIARVGRDVRSWPEDGLRAGQRYYYRITALNEEVNGTDGMPREIRSDPNGASYAVPFLRWFESRMSYVYGNKWSFPAAFLQATPPPPAPGEEIFELPQVPSTLLSDHHCRPGG